MSNAPSMPVSFSRPKVGYFSNRPRIYSTNIGTEYFKHGIHSPCFFLNAVCFIILTYLVPVLFTFYIQGVLKLKKNNSGAKRLRIWWPNTISNKDLWKVTGQEDINVGIRKRKFRRRDQRLPYFGTLRETGREENREIVGEDR